VSKKRREHGSARKGWSYNVWTEPTPLLSKLMGCHAGLPPLPQRRVLLEAGVLAYRRRGHGDIEILLVSKNRSKKWGIPKGRVEPHLSFSELASKEAFEEAGVVGYVSANSVGMFRARKQNTSGLSHQIIEVWVYLFEVTGTLRKWPEMHKREIKWASCNQAAHYLGEPVLMHLCHDLKQSRE
jgi:ADP-ribose pyrophosphatase YjhB (NUDIX family)